MSAHVRSSRALPFRAFVALLSIVCFSTAAAGCSVSSGDDERAVANSAWQVTNVYTTAEYPAVIPDDIAGAVTINFGHSTISGFTGCVPLQGIVRYHSADDGAGTTTVENATSMDITSIEFDELNEETCVGHVRFIHDALMQFFQHTTFTMSYPTNDELLLTVAETTGDDANDNAAAAYADPPALRLAR